MRHDILVEYLNLLLGLPDPLAAIPLNSIPYNGVARIGLLLVHLPIVLRLPAFSSCFSNSRQ